MSLDSIREFIQDSKLTMKDFNVPKFLWVLRDFNNKSKDNHSQLISEKDYLETSLS